MTTVGVESVILVAMFMLVALVLPLVFSVLYVRALTRINQEHQEDVRSERAALTETYQGIVTAILRTQSIGAPVPEPVEIADRDQDPSLRVARRVDRDTIARGVESLRAEYSALGVPITDQELQEEVERIVTGEPYTPAPSLQGFIRD